MGITVDVETHTVSIPETKMSEIITICETTASRESISKRDLQSLLGKFLYISRIIRPARAFLNRMLNTLRACPHHKRVKVEGDFKKDLDWFRAFAREFNGFSTFINWGIEVHDIAYIDASLLGLGAICNNQFYSTCLPPYIKAENRIMVFEMINVLVSMRIWGNSWSNKHNYNVL